MLKTRSFYLALLTLLLSSGAISQVDDGIYVFPDTNQYLTILSNNNVVTTHLFRLDGADSFWAPGRGSRVQDRIEISTTNGTVSGFNLSATALGISMSQLYCHPYPFEVSDCYESGSVTGFPVLKANGRLKAVYRTQYGAEWAVFESDGTGVLLQFEYGEDLSDRTWIGAYTGTITDDLIFTNVETAAESISSENDKFTLAFSIQLSDLDNPQAEINFSCVDNRANPDEQDCDFLREKFFSKLIRIF